MTAQAKRDIRRKLKILEHAEKIGNVRKTCRYYGISRQSFYNWKKRYVEKGDEGLINSKPCPINPSLRTPEYIEELILHLRRKYHFGPDRIAMYLDRYHQVKISGSGAYYVLRRYGLNRLPRNTRRRSPGPHIKRYQKQVPGHHIQVDVKFLMLRGRQDRPVKRFQYTAIDDATRIRVMEVHPRHNQDYAIKFIDHVIEKMPFRIRMVQTDNGHEFQARFHWHLLDLGIDHVYIKPRRPYLNGKVERSHRTDEEEFYQLLEYTDDVDLNEKLEEWEKFYNLHRPHSSHGGNTPYEVLRTKLESNFHCQP